MEDKLNFKDVLGEKSRTYVFDSGFKLTFKDVVRLCVRPSGTHRLETADGLKHIVSNKWIAIHVDTNAWSF